MVITPISSSQPITFKARNPDLKKLWDRGKLPSVKYGIYGDILTKQNVSREHLLPASQGGTTRLGNIALASKEKNNARSNFDIRQFLDPEIAKQYLAQFIDIRTKELNGNKYIKAVLDTLRKLGVNLV